VADGRPAGQFRVGLTGGIGSGKSTVAALLAEHGAVVVEADRLAREVLASGTPGLARVVRRFGSDVLARDGALDRAALAARVFDDDSARADLNEIVHPLVAARSEELMRAAGDAIVVYDVPLLVETGRQREFDVVVSVVAPLQARLARLAQRGLPAEQARSRIAAQASDAERAAASWATLDNDATPAELAERVDALWRRILAERDDRLKGTSAIG
jgi:dephospho-CoA kinase